MLKDKNTKIFVLDTNVILYDFHAIYSFKEHNVVLPITILEEVDKFKKGHDTLNYNAREFVRELNEIIGKGLLNKEVKLKKTGGHLLVDTNIEKEGELSRIFWEDSPDHRILAVAYNMCKKYSKKRVVLVTKDINLRMKAKSVGIHAEDYETGKVKDLDKLFTGKNLIEGVDNELIDKILKDIPVSAEELTGKTPMPNEYFILKNESKSILATYKAEQDVFKHVPKRHAYGIKPRNAEQSFALDCLTDENITLVTLSGKAGTGKTLMALAAAIDIANKYKRILLARPIIPLSNKDIGYLPGDVNEKINPYMQPLFDNLTVIQDQYKDSSKKFAKIEDMLKQGKLLITPLAYIRGRSLSNVFFIIDEAQNLTPHEVKTIITRAGEGTKVVFTGDPYQIDTPYLDSRSNGLSYLIDKMKGQEVYAHVTLEKGERSYLAELASNLL